MRPDSGDCVGACVICREIDGRFRAICCYVICEQRVQPLGLSEEEAGAQRADAFINHRQAEADTGSISYGSSAYSCLRVCVCAYVGVFSSLQATKAPKIAPSWDSKGFKWVDTSFISHSAVQKVTHRQTRPKIEKCT